MSGRRVNFNLRKMMSNLVKPHRLKTQYEVLKFSPILGPQELEFSQVELRSSGLPTSRSCTKEADTWPCVPFKLSICAGAGHLLVLRLSECQMSDFKGAALMVKAIPDAQTLLGDEEYDADWFRHALPDCGITSCIPRKSNRKRQIAFDRTLYKSRHKIGTMFGKLKDWRPIHTTTGTCAHAFISAIVIAVTIIFRINQCGLGLVACHRGCIEIVIIAAMRS